MGDSYYESALLRLRRVAAYLTLKYGEVVKHKQLTPVQFEVLLYVDSSSPSCSVSDVAHFMVVDKSTSSRVLRGIEEKGLIAMDPDPEDRRKRRVLLTSDGEEIVNDCRDAWLEVEKDVRAKYDTAIGHLEIT